MSLFLIILAAGDGKRLKSNIPKPFHKINNKTILNHALDSFKNFLQIKKVIIVYNKKHKKYLNKISIKNLIKIPGGKSRQESTLIALKKINKMNCKKVLIHDAARPNPSKKLISKVIYKLNKNHAVVPILKVNDATKRVRKKLLFKNINRNTLRLCQTPQGFTYKKIYEKHLKNKKVTFDDDSALFIKDKEKIFTIKGSKNNIKITDRSDLKYFEVLKKTKIYYGIGFDVHKLVKGKKLFLGGVKIPFSLGFLGHSDGDPVMHALIDSILGACKLGDIGEKFSNKDNKYKNIRSTSLLKKVIENISLKNFSINNIDINIITEEPKVKKYKNKMIKIISEICNINKNQINIKGKTTEKLGLIGKKKAIASEVITSVKQYD